MNKYRRTLRERNRCQRGTDKEGSICTPCSTSYKVVLEMYMLYMCMFGRCPLVGNQGPRHFNENPSRLEGAGVADRVHIWSVTNRSS